jgi:hypothetical protein
VYDQQGQYPTFPTGGQVGGIVESTGQGGVED